MGPVSDSVERERKVRPQAEFRGGGGGVVGTRTVKGVPPNIYVIF